MYSSHFLLFFLLFTVLTTHAQTTQMKGEWSQSIEGEAVPKSVNPSDSISDLPTPRPADPEANTSVDSIVKPIVKSSRNGYWLPNRDTLRIFMVFAEALDDPGDTYNINPGDNWQRGALPNNAGSYFDVSIEEGGPMKSRMTKFFHQASFGEYVLLGDYYPELIQVPYSDLKRFGDEQVLAVLEEKTGEDIITANGYSLNSGDFDKWSMPNSYGFPKEKGEDGYVDFLVILWRINSKVTKSDNSGSVNVSKWKRPLKEKVGFMDRSRFVSKYSSGGGILQHEYSHSLYGPNNFHNGGWGAGAVTFPSAMGGYSNLGSFGGFSATWNAWDRHRMGWKHPDKTWQISATCVSTGKEVPLDLKYEQAVDCPGMEFWLNDFIESGDVLRIELPYLKSKNELARRQWLWLENHQIKEGNIDHDKRHTKGIYAYVQVGRGDTTDFTGVGNYTTPLNAFGNYDFVIVPDDKRIYAQKNRANPFTGYHFSMMGAYNLEEPNLRINSRGDTSARYENMIFRGENFYPERVFVKGQELTEADFNYKTHPVLGTDFDAFRPGDIISIGHNPAPASVYTWETKASRTSPPNTSPKADDNRFIYLNGIRIEMLEERADGAIKVRLGWKAAALQGDLRWCGRIVAHEDLSLASGASLKLDLGYSPQRPVEPITYKGKTVFADFTELLLEPGVTLKVASGAKLILANGSKLVLAEGAALDMEDGAELLVDNDSEISLGHRREAGQLNMQAGAKIRVEKGATFNLYPGFEIALENGGKIKFCPGSTLRYHYKGEKPTSPPVKVSKKTEVIYIPLP